jgi:hypothetical protein
MLAYESFGLPDPRLMGESGNWISSVDSLLLVGNAVHSSLFRQVGMNSRRTLSRLSSRNVDWTGRIRRHHEGRAAGRDRMALGTRGSRGRDDRVHQDTPSHDRQIGH